MLCVVGGWIGEGVFFVRGIWGWGLGVGLAVFW